MNTTPILLPKKTNCKCDQCFIDIYKTPSELKRNKNNFCSIGCSNKYREKPKIELNCANCSIPIYKTQAEIDYEKKRGTKYFTCSLSCASSLYNSIDEYSPFRSLLKSARGRSKKNNLECTITIEYLKQLWDLQKGMCSISGLPMDLITHGEMKRDINPWRASLDRIDSNLGYISGNVRFVTYVGNCAKNIFSDEVTIKFCEAVTNYQKIKETEPFLLAS